MHVELHKIVRAVGGRRGRPDTGYEQLRKYKVSDKKCSSLIWRSERFSQKLAVPDAVHRKFADLRINSRINAK